MNKLNLFFKIVKYTNCQVSRRTFTRGTPSPWSQDKGNPPRTLVVRDLFENAEKKDRKTYLQMIEIFEAKDKFRRGHVEFIANALKYMEEFGVHKDIEVYKALINVLPKGKFIPQNIFQSEFMHYPKQQQVAIDLLEQMEDNGVIPDVELEDILRNIFGRRGHPVRKYMRMLYWMPKFKNVSPWPIPESVPNDPMELARLAIERITSVDLQTTITVYQTNDVENSIDDTWIVSGQSPKQIELLGQREKQSAVFVEGAFKLWLRDTCVNYFILRSDPLERRRDGEDRDEDDVSHIKIPMYEVPKQIAVPQSVHEQDDGVILAICATGTSSKDSLLSWIRLLEQNHNPNLAQLSVVFTLKQAATQLVSTHLNDSDQTQLSRLKK